MVRNYVKKNNPQNQNAVIPHAIIANAIQKVKSQKLSIRRAAKDANIHEKTLRRYIMKDLANPDETIEVQIVPQF